jgi:hypothetical protein
LDSVKKRRNPGLMKALILVNPQAGNRKGARWLSVLRDLSARLGPGKQVVVEPTMKVGLAEPGA